MITGERKAAVGAETGRRTFGAPDRMEFRSWTGRFRVVMSEPVLSGAARRYDDSRHDERPVWVLANRRDGSRFVVTDGTFMILNVHCCHMSRAADAGFDVNRTEAVPENARVRDFDELDDAAQGYLLHVVEGASPRDPSNLSDLEEGDVIVFTDYYRVR
jgi:hypothetical protein